VDLFPPVEDDPSAPYKTPGLVSSDVSNVLIKALQSSEVNVFSFLYRNIITF
jgi:hypothetical protein